MRRASFTVTLFVIAFYAQVAQAVEPADERFQFQGLWEIASISESKPSKLASPEGKRLSFRVAFGKLFMGREDGVAWLPCTIAPQAKPKQLDIHLPFGPMRCIYELDEEELTIAIPDGLWSEPSVRPEEFEPVAGVAAILVLKRVKAERPPE
jgi:uncharacterized protein (TIGR03067 family)